jgi:GNAT superfamily N-acetyltransferase
VRKAVLISVIANDDRTEDDRAQLRRLNELVYPPDEDQDSAESHITWAPTELSIFVRMESGSEVVAHAGVLARECLLNNRQVLIGGIGGVKTHPGLRHHGLGRLVMTRAAEVLRDDLAVDFGLLAYPPSAEGFYKRLGWREFNGVLLVDQPEGRTEFTVNRVMVLPLNGEAPTSGKIDLLGLPW